MCLITEASGGRQVGSQFPSLLLLSHLWDQRKLDLLINVIWSLSQPGGTRQICSESLLSLIPQIDMAGSQALPGKCCLPGLAVEQPDVALQVDVARLHTRHPAPPKPQQLPPGRGGSWGCRPESRVQAALFPAPAPTPHHTHTHTHPYTSTPHTHIPAPTPHHTATHSHTQPHNHPHTHPSSARHLTRFP